MFDLESCTQSAQNGNLQEWVLDYLAAGYWANLGLRDGLLLQKRYWIGPVSIELSRLERCCGPEDGMIYHVPNEVWKERIDSIALGLVDAKSLPPLIVEWRDGHWWVLFPKTPINETGFVAEIYDCEGNRIAVQST
ncbi:hypothetical protein [Rhizobium rhizogenes]|uniref:Uncharacterized protein n=1 Tax=Rhizobium rhizogenes NBRC 13257 TaxID=1220581 RepID=A0AA87QF55_RHIRH|nr:hypothetical protein [Rhizobium rhizogenes]GAJ97009.1 hypothetical protein RRH01S_29_00360 [Rhizobium rhizogenes NBRC 13257]